MSRRIKAFVAISHSLSDWFIAQSPPLRCPVEIIPNGIDTNHFAPISRQQKSQLLEQRFPGAAKKTFILGTCARLEAIKNIEFMIEIFAVFNKKHPDTMLILIGDGSRRHHLEELAIAHHVQDHILFVGLIEDVYQWLPLFDLYLITSFDEGLPLSVLEAMSCNIPVIANSVGELPSIITPETGKLTQTLAVKEWIDILEDFYNSTKASESPPISGGRRAAQSSYSINSCVDSYLHLLLN
jgi:glycosyltransferase involved in cell wall biosynthesis